MIDLKFGGTLEIGDLIAVSNGNYMSFGWFAGTGSGTIQFYYYGEPGSRYEDYKNWLNEPEDKRSKWKNYEKGFTKKSLWKAYIYGSTVGDTTRIIKITHPEDVFTTPEDRNTYEKSKEAMIFLNLIKK
jgi:hypothetical protein